MILTKKQILALSTWARDNASLSTAVKIETTDLHGGKFISVSTLNRHDTVLIHNDGRVVDLGTGS